MRLYFIPLCTLSNYALNESILPDLISVDMKKLINSDSELKDVFNKIDECECKENNMQNN